MKAGQQVIYLSPNGNTHPAKILEVIEPLRGAKRFRIEISWRDGSTTTAQVLEDRLEVKRDGS